eukprot:2627306-Amphidinium_carterae.1
MHSTSSGSKGSRLKAWREAVAAVVDVGRLFWWDAPRRVRTEVLVAHHTFPELGDVQRRAYHLEGMCMPGSCCACPALQR